MESEKSDDEQDPISQQIVDYYKKYSQNKNLPKYFTGSSVSYMPQIVKDDEIDPPVVVVEDTNSNPDDFQQPADPKPVSPASSVASNRKLEWDSGADIGYNNCKLYKSTSLPTIIGDLKHAHEAPVQFVVNLEQPHAQSTSSSSPTDNPTSNRSTTTTTSTATNNKLATFSTSSSSGAKLPTSTTTSTTSYLKRKIGSPSATSTPNLAPGLYYTQTPFVRKQKTCHKNRIVQLGPTRPTIVECFDTARKDDKNIQTSIAEALPKCVQTGDSLVENLDNREHPTNQSVFVVNYESEAKTSSINTACDSFEYCDAKSESSDAVPVLSQLISQRQSASLIRDVDRSIELLEKLLKSKKYDAATKKRYIKKIVDKIVNSKYSEDSTESSELFVPKKQNGAGVQKLQDNIPWCPPQLSKFTVKTFSDQFLPKDSKSSSYKSWKEDKTASERLLEQKQRGQGDQLVDFAKKERRHQLAWINDEITHLTKLRSMLEKKIHTTTVYMLSQHSNKSSESSGTDSGRNYVIQTELSTSSSSELPLEFNYSDQNGRRKYKIEQAGVNIDGNIVGDIEVVSDDKTTNIKVKTRDTNEKKEFVPKPPRLVGGGKYDTFPPTKAEEKCWPCGMLKPNNKCWPCGMSKPKDKCWPCGMPKSKPYSVEIPLQGEVHLKDKIREILNKYTALGSDCTCKCTCRGNCDKQVQTSSSSKDESLQVKSCACAKAGCSCDKQVQTSLASKDESLQVKCCGCAKAGCNCDKQVQTCLSNKNESLQAKPSTQSACTSHSTCNTTTSSIKTTSTSSSASISESSTEPTESCVCCKRKNVTTQELYKLRKKLSDQAAPLCRPCYRQNRRCVHSPNYYNNPTHVCNCYTMIQTKTLDEIKKTINDLSEMDKQYCQCLDSTRGNCKYCKCKLRHTTRNRNGIAYMLTLEDGSIKEEKPKHRKKHLEEIKIKIPLAHKKKHKDKTNNKRKRRSEEEEAEGATLQEYLSKNRPEFVQEADDRRRSVNVARIQREEETEDNKLKFLKKSQEKCEKSGKRLFSAKEMKDINIRNYKKLPEVQRKLIDNREKQIRQANRLIADTFNKKLRENVLKGKRDLPTDINVVNL